MPSTKKLLQAAAGNAGGDKLYVEDVFSTYLYTGTGATLSIVNDIDLDGEGGLVWVKSRDTVTYHHLTDTERGANKDIYSNDISAQFTETEALKVFNSNGFTIGTQGQYNTNGEDYASWTFRKAPGFFDVVTYTGNGVVGRTVAHNLGSVPGFIVVKRLDTANHWSAYHRSLGNAQQVWLDRTADAGGSGTWDSTTPTDTEFTLSNGASVNFNGGTYVAYLFAHDVQEFGSDGDESVIKCGSLNNSTPAVLGWEPSFIITKRIDADADWYILDAMRGLTVEDAGIQYLETNTTNAEAASGGSVGMLINSQGFSTGNNGTYIYIAIRRPMKTPEAGTEVYNNLANRIGTSAAATISGVGFAVDLMIPFAENTGSSKPFVDRLRGATKYLLPPYTNAEQTTTDAVTSFASNDGVLVGADASLQVINNYYNSSRRYAASFFKRATGFMDVVCYTGTGSPANYNHNLGVVPEMMITRARTGSNNWFVYNADKGNNFVVYLNSDYSGGTDGGYRWNQTTPTASVFTNGTNAGSSGSGVPFVAYLFATLDGVSKVGSYTGTGADLNVDCGFTAGARYILIKRTDSTGDWYMWDSARGINAGNSPYLIMNTTGASVTTTDYIDPLNAGFTVTSTAPAAINASGGSYIFLAIA
jgi:hypothetical protein